MQRSTLITSILLVLLLSSCSKEVNEMKPSTKVKKASESSYEYDRMVGEGMNFINANRRDEAIMVLNKAIDLDPNRPYAYNNRGLAYYGNGEIEKAISDYRKAIEIDPNSIVMMANMGNALSKQKKYSEALKYYRKALGKDDGKQGYLIRINIARVLMQTGKYDDALKELDSAQKMEPYSPNSFMANGIRGMILYHKKEYRKAILELEKSKKDFPEIQFYTGMCYEKLGKKEIAFKYYQDALLTSKAFPLLREMRKQIVSRIKRLKEK